MVLRYAECRTSCKWIIVIAKCNNNNNNNHSQAQQTANDKVESSSCDNLLNFRWVCIWKMHYYHVSVEFVIRNSQLATASRLMVIYQNLFRWHHIFIILLSVSFELDENCEFLSVHGILFELSQLSRSLHIVEMKLFPLILQSYEHWTHIRNRFIFRKSLNLQYSK